MKGIDMTQSEQLHEISTKLRTFCLAHNLTMGRMRSANLRRALDLVTYEEDSIRGDEQRDLIIKNRHAQALAEEAQQQELERRGVLLDEPASTYGVKGSPE